MTGTDPPSAHRRWPRLYVVIDSGVLAQSDPVAAAAAAIDGGARLIQWRAKGLGRAVGYDLARRLRALARAHGTELIINDDIALARAVDADGVHLGQDDLPADVARRLLGAGFFLGMSAHTPELARRAQAAGADYVGVGPVFVSTTKQARPALGVDGLAAICRAVTIPVYGIGGIDLSNARELLRAGAYGAAVVSAVLRAPDIAAATRALVQRLERA